MEESLLKDSHRIFNAALIFGLPDFCRDNGSMIVLGPCGIIFVKIRLDPVLVGYDSLFAVVAYDDCRDASELTQSMVVYFDPLRFFC